MGNILLCLGIIAGIGIVTGFYKGLSNCKSWSSNMELLKSDSPYFSFGISFEGYEEVDTRSSLAPSRIVETLNIGLLWMRVRVEFIKNNTCSIQK